MCRKHSKLFRGLFQCCQKREWETGGAFTPKKGRILLAVSQAWWRLEESCSGHGLCCEIPSLCFTKSLLTQVWEAAATSTVNQIAFHNKGNKYGCDFNFSFMDFS